MHPDDAYHAILSRVGVHSLGRLAFAMDIECRTVMALERQWRRIEGSMPQKVSGGFVFLKALCEEVEE
eukprot:11225244-Lingulodinium_polyedra.AAC.1